MKNHEEFLTHFVKQRHALLMEFEAPDPAYEKAFLASNTDTDSEYTTNTTTWD